MFGLAYYEQVRPYEIVGVAGDAKYQDIRTAAPPIVYLFARMSNTLSLWTDVSPIAVAAEARRIVAEVLGADSVRRVTTRVKTAHHRERPREAATGTVRSPAALFSGTSRRSKNHGQWCSSS